jgi:hypothetical protein
VVATPESRRHHGERQVDNHEDGSRTPISGTRRALEEGVRIHHVRLAGATSSFLHVLLRGGRGTLPDELCDFDLSFVTNAMDFVRLDNPPAKACNALKNVQAYSMIYPTSKYLASRAVNEPSKDARLHLIDHELNPPTRFKPSRRAR